MKIYGDINSGNCYKLHLVCQLLNIEHDWIHIDILKGETKTREFLALSPAGKIPLLVTDQGETLSESNAILNYLCEGSALYPSDIWHRAKVHQWQFFEQYSHEPYIAVARFINKYLGLPEERINEYKSKQEGGNSALRIMENQLTQTLFLTGDSITTCDISLFAYTHVAHEGGFDLNHYPNILKWIERIKSQEHFSAMA